MPDDMEREILKIMAELDRPARCKDIAEVMGVKHDSVSCMMTPLAEKGLIEKAPEGGGYRLTPKGRKRLEETPKG